MILEGFPPVLPENPKVLILGSMPGVESLRKQQYYGHPRNAFWFIMGELVGAKPELGYKQRCEILQNHGIVLWDVLKHCKREGSLDSAIVGESEVANRIPELLEEKGTIKAIFFNGKKAEQAFKKHILKYYPEVKEKVEFFSLPSTSPAYALQRPQQKLEKWTVIEKFLA